MKSLYKCKFKYLFQVTQSSVKDIMHGTIEKMILLRLLQQEEYSLMKNRFMNRWVNKKIIRESCGSHNEGQRWV